MIDTHCHLNFERFNDDADQVVERMLQAGVLAAIVVGSDLVTSQKAVELAHKHDCLYAAVGIHPCHMDRVEKGWQDKIAGWLGDPKVVAIGETGFDYINNLEYQSDRQRTVLAEMIGLANKYEKPLILHARESTKELLDFITEHPLDVDGVLHCYCESENLAERAIGMGLHISFTGMITYPKNESVRTVVENSPHDRVMIETDSPYLPPQSKRGQRCEPADVVEVARTIADIWGVEVSEVQRITDKNARQFFKIN